jgi:hypothetical protein
LVVDGLDHLESSARDVQQGGDQAVEIVAVEGLDEEVHDCQSPGGEVFAPLAGDRYPLLRTRP